MRVYVLEVGDYADRQIKGVYVTAEAAMSAHQPIKKPPRVGRDPMPYEWLDCGRDYWDFRADYDDRASVEGYEVIEIREPSVSQMISRAADSASARIETPWIKRENRR